MIHENNWADYSKFISFTGYVSFTGTAVAPPTIQGVFSPMPILISGVLTLQVFVDL
jgi:hypothetical protein